MDILLVSGRSRTPHSHPSREFAATLARDLTERGHGVRWLRPGRAEEPAARLPEAAACLPVVSRPARFRAIEKSLSDVPTERALSLEIRRQLPDVVHVLAFGGASSATSVWIADRMGLPTVVTVDARELLCHRGTLVNEKNAACDEWNRPERCVVCCMSPFDGGLSPEEARRGRLLRIFGRWSAYPKAVDFRNRLDLLVGGLMPATLVLVADDGHRDSLVAAGVPARALRVTGIRKPEAEPLVILYEEAARRRATGGG